MQIVSYETICMKCQILFSRKIRKNISKCLLLKTLPNMQSVKREFFFIIAPDKVVVFFFNQKLLICILFIHENIFVILIRSTSVKHFKTFPSTLIYLQLYLLYMHWALGNVTDQIRLSIKQKSFKTYLFANNKIIKIFRSTKQHFTVS